MKLEHIAGLQIRRIERGKHKGKFRTLTGSGVLIDESDIVEFALDVLRMNAESRINYKYGTAGF